MRFRSIQAGPLMQMPVFLLLFFAPVYVPLDLLNGWIETVATASTRSRTSSRPGGASSRATRREVALAFGVAFVLIAVFAVWGVPRPPPRRGGGLTGRPGAPARVLR